MTEIRNRSIPEDRTSKSSGDGSWTEVPVAQTTERRRGQLLDIIGKNPDAVVYGGISNPCLRIQHRAANPRIWGELDRNTA